MSGTNLCKLGSLNFRKNINPIINIMYIYIYIYIIYIELKQYSLKGWCHKLHQLFIICGCESRLSMCNSAVQ